MAGLAPTEDDDVGERDDDTQNDATSQEPSVETHTALVYTIPPAWAEIHLKTCTERACRGQCAGVLLGPSRGGSGSESLVSATPDFPPKDAAPGHHVELELVGGEMRAMTDSIYVVPGEHHEAHDVPSPNDPEPQLSKPPSQDMRLLDYFTGNDLQPQSLHGSFQAMSETSFARAVPDPDARLINSGSVGFKQRSEADLLGRAEKISEDDEPDPLRSERVSKAQRHRETKAILDQLDAPMVKILRLAFGPQDQIPLLKMTEQLPRSKHNMAAIASYEQRKALGPWRQVLPETAAARAAHLEYCHAVKPSQPMLCIELWLLEFATRKSERTLLAAIQLEAYRAVRAAWNAWADKRGRRRAFGDSTYEREEQVKPWDQ